MFTESNRTPLHLQKFSSFNLAVDGDKRVLDADGEETLEFLDPLRVQYRDIVEVCWMSARYHER